RVFRRLAKWICPLCAHAFQDQAAPFDLRSDEFRVLLHSFVTKTNTGVMLHFLCSNGNCREWRRYFVGSAGGKGDQGCQTVISREPSLHEPDLAFLTPCFGGKLADKETDEQRGRCKRNPHTEKMQRDLSGLPVVMEN